MTPIPLHPVTTPDKGASRSLVNYSASQHQSRVVPKGAGGSSSTFLNSPRYPSFASEADSYATSNNYVSTVAAASNELGTGIVMEVSESQGVSGGFQLSKYVRDIGLRARSLVGGLLKREEDVVQASVCPCLCVVGLVISFPLFLFTVRASRPSFDFS